MHIFVKVHKKYMKKLLLSEQMLVDYFIKICFSCSAC